MSQPPHSSTPQIFHWTRTRRNLYGCGKGSGGPVSIVSCVNTPISSSGCCATLVLCHGFPAESLLCCTPRLSLPLPITLDALKTHTPRLRSHSTLSPTTDMTNYLCPDKILLNYYYFFSVLPLHTVIDSYFANTIHHPYFISSSLPLP